MDDLRERIKKANSKKKLNKIVQEALNKYGFFSKEYGEILNLCYDKLKTL